MFDRRIPLAILLASATTACATSRNNDAPDEKLDEIATLIVREAPELAIKQPKSGAPAPIIIKGTDSFTGTPRKTPSMSAEEEVLDVDLENASIADAADLVLGDILGVNYAIDEGVQGTITIKTSAPIPRHVLLSIFEGALQTRGAVLIDENGVYRVAAAEKAVLGSPGLSVGKPSQIGVGFSVQVVPLRFVSAVEMERILKPISSPGSVVRVDRTRNALTLSGSRREIDSLMEAIELFDVDWLKGMSFGLIPVKSAEPKAIASELSAVFSNGASQPLEGVIRFIPNERLNAILIISSRSSYLEDARAWVERLDNPDASGGDQVFVYNVQNRSAESLAGVLQSFFGGGASQQSGIVQPGSTPRTIGEEPPSDSVRPGENGPNLTDAPGAPAGKIRIAADEVNNALLVYASPYEYQRILSMLEKLDVIPNQVMIEATIAEVTLNDQLEHGLSWFFENAESRVAFSDVPSGAVNSIFPGFSYVFSESDARVALNAIASVTDVKVVSSPTLMVLDNKTARLQVGDQVPVATQSAVSTINPDAPIVNSVSFRDTGVILNITPRVSDSGVVVLDITQEVSSVTSTTTSGIDSPTIQQRRIETSVAVHDGESLALGGLIEDSRNVTSSGVPFLSKIPLLGEAFKSKRKEVGRTELLVLITPRVVRDREQARLVTDEFRNRLESVRDLIEKSNVNSSSEQSN